MDWWAELRFLLPVVFWLLLMGCSAWYGARQRRGTIVCPTCGGAGRVRPATGRGEGE
jgi:hypothetical protein